MILVSRDSRLLSYLLGLRLARLCRLWFVGGVLLSLLLLLFQKLLLLDVLLLLLVAQVLLCVLWVGVIVRGVLHHLIIDVTQIFQHIYKLHSLSLNICLVGVSNKIHIDFAVACRAGTCLSLLLLVRIERILLIEVIKVLI